MIMRDTARICAATIVLLALAVFSHAATSAQVSSFQSLILGDTMCPPEGLACQMPFVPVQHRYLHVILHDAPTNADWHVLAGPTCAAATPLIGGQPISDNGYLEIVASLDAQQSVPHSLCLVFLGGGGYWVTYYAAYLDDTSTPDASDVYPSMMAAGGRPDLPDLDVMFIHRAPEYAYDAKPNGPAVGQVVTFQAHVGNAGVRPAQAFTYLWMLDGRQIGAGTVHDSLAPGSSATISLPFRWTARPATLSFEIVPTTADASLLNNRLNIRTTALSLGFWIEQSAFRYFKDQQWLYCRELACRGSNSFYDWLERQVAAWNSLLAGSTSPSNPGAALDRVRVEQVTVVPDGALPLHGGRPTNNPDSRDRSVDLEWGLPARNVQMAYPHKWEGQFDMDWSLVHELGHARSLADLYRFDMPLGQGNGISAPALDGSPIFDAQHPVSITSKLHPFESGRSEMFLYQDQEQDLMECACNSWYSAYTVTVLNRIEGRRASCGNENLPCNLGDWYLDIPPINRLHIDTAAGTPIADGSRVRLLFDVGTGYNVHAFRDTSYETLVSRRGNVQLGADPFRAGNSTWAAGHNLDLLEVSTVGKDVVCFLEPTVFNLAYWDGYRDAAHPASYTLTLGKGNHNACGLIPPPVIVNEPFATSTSASTIHFHGTHSLVVHLLDSASPPDPMRHREIDVLDSAQKLLARCVTNAHGECFLTVFARHQVFTVIDSTDNNLVIPWRR